MMAENDVIRVRMRHAMAGRPTIQDIATEAGVSVTTVDRVLNGRLKVREETAGRDRFWTVEELRPLMDAEDSEDD